MMNLRTPPLLKVVALLLVVGIVLAVASARSTQSLAASETDFSDILWWLPENTQTVIAVRGPLKPQALPQSPADWDAVDMLRTLAGWWRKRDSDGPSPDDGNIQLAVTGSRKYRAPEGWGSGTQEIASIILYDRNKNSTWDEMRSRASRKEKILGTEVLEFDPPFEGMGPTEYSAHPKPNILISSTNRNLLSEILARRRAGRKGKRALPANLSEWRYVDQKSPLWAVRHYDQSDAAEDESSPLSSQTGRAYDPQAIGLIIAPDVSKPELLRLRILSHNPNPERIALERWNLDDGGLKHTIQRLDELAVEITLTLPKHHDLNGEFTLNVLFSLGYIINL